MMRPEHAVKVLIKRNFHFERYTSDLFNVLENARKFFNHFNLRDYCHLHPEYIVYRDTRLAGSMDLVMLDRSTMEITIVDWKTSTNMFSYSGEKKLNKYYCQTHVYAKMIQHYNHLLRANMLIVNFNVDKFNLFGVPDVDQCPNCQYFEDKL